MTVRPRLLRLAAAPFAPRNAALGITLAGIVTVATACAGGAAASGTTGSSGGGNGTQAAGGASHAGANRPETTGVIAQLNGSSIFVQNQQAQTQVTVNFNADTRFTQTVAAAAGTLKVGDCVSATAAAASSSASPSPSAGQSVVTHLTATEVTITGTDLTCTRTGGFGSGNRTFPSGGPSAFARPSTGARPSGAPRGNFGSFRDTAFGKVSAVNGTSFVVTSTRGSGSSAKTTEITVTTTGSTTYRQTTAATKADLKVGLCASAIGTTDDTGAVTARSITLIQKSSNGCTFGGSGFGRMGGFGGPEAGGHSQASG